MAVASIVGLTSGLLVPPAVPMHRVRVQLSSARMDAVTEDEACYLFDTAEGRKYVCTSNPEELAWHMGLDMKDLITGVKPEDLNLIECSEEWSHTGTPQWACKEEEKDVEACEMIGETNDEVWFACKDGADMENVDCSENTDFGVGGGPGILPQDGEKLCKQEKPK